MTTGLPRPMARPGWSATDGETPPPLLPLPWINADAPDEDGTADFYAFRDDSRRAETERRCCICGDPLNTLVVLGAFQGKRETSGGWGHPRCLHMAVRLCPHFDRLPDEATVAWLHTGDGVGLAHEATLSIDDVHPDATPMDRAAVATLARTNPWGHAPSSPAAHPDTTGTQVGGG